MTDAPLPPPDESVAARRDRVEAFGFHDLHPHLHFGTASDRYAGWLGQIYPDTYSDSVSTRQRNLGGKSFQERTLPVASVEAYFEHFSVLELDFTFYTPLRKPDGEPASPYFVLQQYADFAPANARFFLKAPQPFFARTLRRSKGGKTSYEENPRFLDADAYTRLFHEPALEILGDRLVGLIFEQEYQRVSESPPPEANIAELDAFFRAIPNDVQAHIELRSPHLLVPAYFDWLEAQGLGFVFSHWTWLPPLRRQWSMCGERFTAADHQVIVRLLTPLNMPYAKAYAQAHPFDRALPAIAESREGIDMVLDVVALLYRAEDQRRLLNIIANNRAWGNAPTLAQAIAYRILEEELRRS